MKLFTHKLSGHTYSPLNTVSGGVIFKVIETGKQKEMSDNQIQYLLKIKG